MPTSLPQALAVHVMPFILKGVALCVSIFVNGSVVMRMASSSWTCASTWLRCDDDDGCEWRWDGLLSECFLYFVVGFLFK